MTADPVFAGWHGKLPSLGDFAMRRLDLAFVEAWDHWVSSGLATLRLREGWLDAYLGSPVWRFLLLPGVLPGAVGERAWAGVLMPSVDRVGRYYPLTIAAPLHALPADTAEVEALWRWLVRLDEVAADALHEDWTIDTLEAELLRLPQPTLGARPLPSPVTGQPVVLELPLGTAPHAGLLLAAQAASAWAERSRGLAYWSAQPDVGEPRLLVSRGLDRGHLPGRLLGSINDNSAG